MDKKSPARYLAHSRYSINASYYIIIIITLKFHFGIDAGFLSQAESP